MSYQTPTTCFPHSTFGHHYSSSPWKTHRSSIIGFPARARLETNNCSLANSDLAHSDIPSQNSNVPWNVPVFRCCEISLDLIQQTADDSEMKGNMSDGVNKEGTREVLFSLDIRLYV